MHARDFSLDTLLANCADRHGHRLATVDGTQRLTWAQLDARVTNLACWLLERGIAPGDRIALLLTDGAPFLATLLAAGRIGAIAVLRNWRLAPGEIAWICGNAEPAMTFVNPRFSDLLSGAAAGEVHQVDESHAGDGFFETVAGTAPGPIQHGYDLGLNLSPDRPVYMMYTSGTTGRPKGCLQAGSAVAASALGFAQHRRFTPEERLLSVNPLFHVVGMQQVAAMLACGAPACSQAAMTTTLQSLTCSTAKAAPRPVPFLRSASRGWGWSRFAMGSCRLPVTPAGRAWAARKCTNSSSGTGMPA